jgi:hypothetical protein
MNRFCLAALAVIFLAPSAYAQMDGKTGRTPDGLQNDAAFDKEYRARTEHPTPDVKSDPWGSVRTTSATADNKPAAANKPDPAHKAKKR